MTVHIRPATSRDLSAALYVWLAAEGSVPDRMPAENDPVPSSLSHALDSGTMQVAEQAGQIVGFGAAIAREPVSYLGQLFVLPDLQSGGVGRGLLQAVMPEDVRQRSTVASSDPRAVSLYVRHGMRPFWPVFDVGVSVDTLSRKAPVPVDVVEAEAGDQELVRLDAEIGGRLRPEDHAYWVARKASVPLWFERDGKRLGYAYVQLQPQSDDAAWYGQTVRVGPSGVHDVADATDCLLAALDWAREHGDRLTILVPGPHPALGTLLNAGFRINDIETFLYSGETPFTDGQRYIPSGGGLF